jgi:hypothetical protein
VGPEASSLLAAVLVAAIGALVIGIALTERRGLLPSRSIAVQDWTGVLAAGLSVGAAAIHFAVIGEHYAEYPAYGVFFALLAWFQIGWAFAYVVRRDARLAGLAVVVNAGAIVVWVLSRTAGLPIGPEPWTPEAIGPLDTVATALEAAMIAVLGLGLLPARLATRARLPLDAAIAYVGSAFLAMSIVTTAAFASAGEAAHGAAAHGHSGTGHESEAPGLDLHEPASPSARSSSSPSR